MKKLALISDDKNFKEKFKEHMEFGEEFKIYDFFCDEREKIEGIDPSAVIIDISRENLKEGVFFLEFLKGLKSLGSIPVIVISNYNDPDFLYRILKEGANDFVEKTEDFNLIKDRIKKILG